MNRISRAIKNLNKKLSSDKKKMQNNRRGIKEMEKVNNKTIENAKMVSFRIITEFLL